MSVKPEEVKKPVNDWAEASDEEEEEDLSKLPTGETTEWGDFKVTTIKIVDVKPT
jgi:hypothetical protein